MLRSTLLNAAVAIAIPLVAISASSAGATSGGKSLEVPSAITQWFQEKGAEAARRDAREMIDEDQAPRGVENVSLGKPIPKVLPVNVQYDLKNDQVVGTTQLTESNLVVSEYCAIATFDEAVSGILECADFDDSGKVIESSAGTLSKPVASEAHLDALVQYDFVGTLGIDVEKNAFVALEADAVGAIGGTTIDAVTFLTAEGKRWAESEAIERLNGPQEGGGGDLSLNLSPSDQAKRDALVSEALALPDDLAWHEGDDFAEVLSRRDAAAQTTASSPIEQAREPSRPFSTDRHRGVFTGAAVSALAVLGLISAMIARRRTRRRLATTPERGVAGGGTED